MMAQALALLSDSFTAVVGWWGDIIAAIPGSLQVITAAFVMFGAIRFLILPIFGPGMGAGSDFAWHQKDYRDGTQKRIGGKVDRSRTRRKK